MIEEIIVGIYALLVLVVTIKSRSQLPKSALSGFVSGLILLFYSLYLHAIGTLKDHAFILFLAVFILQIAPMEVGWRRGRINWVHHSTRLVIHILIVYLLLYLR